MAQIPDTLIGKRDGAIPPLGFAGAFRRAEVVSTDVEHCAVTPEGRTIDLKNGKAYQKEEGRLVGIPRGENEERHGVDDFAGHSLRGGPGDLRRRGREVGTGHNEPDRAPLSQNGAPLHPPGISVSRKCR